MTQETPEQEPAPDTIHCDDCDRPVRLHRDDDNTLSVTCGCSWRSIKVATVFPEGWQR